MRLGTSTQRKKALRTAHSADSSPAQLLRVCLRGDMQTVAAVAGNSASPDWLLAFIARIHVSPEVLLRVSRNANSSKRTLELLLDRHMHRDSRLVSEVLGHPRCPDYLVTGMLRRRDKRGLQWAAEAVAARDSAPEDVLSFIYAEWGDIERVQMLLADNPSCPQDVAHQLLTRTSNARVLQRIARNYHLPESVRVMAGMAGLS